MTGEIRIDWASAKVRERQLTVPLAEIAPKDWVKAVSDVVERLERSGQASGDVKVTRKKLRVSGVQPGVEPGLRHTFSRARCCRTTAVSTTTPTTTTKATTRNCPTRTGR